MELDISIVVVNYGSFELLLDLLDSILNSNDTDFIKEIVIVDNGFPHKGDSREVVDAFAFPFATKFVQNKESSYASGVNRGVLKSSGEILIIANNDIKLLPNSSIKPLVTFIKDVPHSGIVGPQLIYQDGTWQRSHGSFPSIKEALISLFMVDTLCNLVMKCLFKINICQKHPKTVGYIDGAFMVIRRTCFEELGGFNEDYSFYGEDSDFCKRAHQVGWRAVFFPTVFIMHVRGASSTKEALECFTVQLILAKKQFIEEHFGPRRARLYVKITHLAYLERAILYNLVSKFVPSSNLRTRAKLAKAKHIAIKESLRY